MSTARGEGPRSRALRSDCAGRRSESGGAGEAAGSGLSSWLTVPQRVLGPKGLLALLAVSSFMTPLSLDMYTPAVPYLPAYFGTSAAVVNVTLSGFFLCFTLGMLIMGPASDRFGRRWALLVSYALYTAGSLVCALAPSIEVLIAARFVQGLGAGGAGSVGTAIVKDAFVVERRGTILSIMQVLFLIGPVAAPLLGGVIIRFFDWRASFWALVGVGAFAFVASACFAETIADEDRASGSALQVARRLLVVAKNPGFMVFLLVTSALDLCFMAYIASASYIYMDYFGLSEMGYSLFFSAAALVTMAGPFIFSAASHRVSVRAFTTAVYVIALIGGAYLVLLGSMNVVAFLVGSLVVPMIQSAVRPYSTNILLDQQSSDTGSASAIINFVHGAIGAFGMVVAVLPWPNYIVGLGVITVAAMAAGLAAWTALLKSESIPLKGVKD